METFFFFLLLSNKPKMIRMRGNSHNLCVCEVLYQRLLYNFTFQPREERKKDQNQEAFEANVQVIIGCGWVE